MQNLARSVVVVGVLMLVSAPPAGPQTDGPRLLSADAICTAPPFDDRARSVLRRLPGYDHVLDIIVDRCPDVAMIFAEFSVGDIGTGWRRPVLDYLWLLDFPTGRVEADNN